MNDQTQQKISRALSRLVAKLPFYGALALSFPIKQTTVPTAATDGAVIYINPAFIEPLSVAQTAFILAHEAAHIAQLHCYRQKSLNLDPRLYNMAADYAIHSHLIPAAKRTIGAIDLPCDESGKFLGLYDPKYDGLSAEEIYCLLENEQDNPQDNTQDPNNSNSPHDIFAGDVLPAANTQDPTAEAAVRERVKRALERAVQAGKSKGVGDVPSWATAALEELNSPRFDWREILRRFIVTTRAPHDYTWARPNRRFAYQKLILPSTEGQQTQPVGVMIDVSASVHHHIPFFLSELLGIIDQHPTELVLIFVDTVVQQTHCLTQYDIDESTLREIAQQTPMGGGTDLRAGFRWFIESSPVPIEALIVLTDGETPWPSEDAALSLPPTIVVLTPNGVKPPTYLGQWVKLEDSV